MTPIVVIVWASLAAIYLVYGILHVQMANARQQAENANNMMIASIFKLGDRP